MAFSFNTRQRTGIWVMLVGIALLIGGRYLWRMRATQPGKNGIFLASGEENAQQTSSGAHHARYGGGRKEAHPIDINTADTTAWRSLPGIGPVLSRRIVRYREAVGGFQEPEDLLRVFGLPEETFEALRPFLLVNKETRPAKRTEAPPKWADNEPVDINIADTALLNALPGIGPVLAERIVKFRSAKKGFERVEDLKAVYGLPPETYAKLASRLYVEQETFAALRNQAPASSAYPAENQRLIASRGIEEEVATPAKPAIPAVLLNLNTATETELQAIPGLSASLASRIVKLRTSMGFWADANMLIFVYGMDPQKVEALKPYLAVTIPAEAKKKNLNMMDVKDLKRYIFLTEAQAESLVNQRKKLGMIRSWEQLTSMDSFTLQRLKAYFSL